MGEDIPQHLLTARSFGCLSSFEAQKSQTKEITTAAMGGMENTVTFERILISLHLYNDYPDNVLESDSHRIIEI